MRTSAQKPKVLQQSTSAKSTIPDRARFGQSRELGLTHNLQRKGNQTVLRLLRDNLEGAEDNQGTEASTVLGHNIGRIPVQACTVAIQPKRTVNEPGDDYELEADNVADQVMRMPDFAVQRRRGEERSGSEESAPLRESMMSAYGGSGQPLPDGVRSYFEPRFGRDFSHVRVHENTRAARLSRQLSAQAFTHGQDIYFGAGRFDPVNPGGRRLLAHELAHTVQQSRGVTGRIQRAIKVTDKGLTTPPHKKTNGDVALDMFNELCRDFSWHLNGDAIEPVSAADCSAAKIAGGATTASCGCACHFAAASGPNVNIIIHATRNDTLGNSTGGFDIHLTGQASTTIEGVQGPAPSKGSPIRTIADPAWLILGHELCGHAMTTYPLNASKPGIDREHQMSQGWDETAVDIENVLRREHGAARGIDMGLRTGSFQNLNGEFIHGSIVPMPKAMTLGDLMKALNVPVMYTFPRCPISSHNVLGCTSLPTTPKGLKNMKIVTRVMDADTMYVPFDCRKSTFSQGKSFMIEGVFWHRAKAGESKNDVAGLWGVTVSDIDTANQLFNTIHTLAPNTALPTGQSVIIPYKRAPGSTRYFLISQGSC